jgi:hypothetical protein
MEVSNDTLYRYLCGGAVAHDRGERGITKVCTRAVWQQ